MMLTEAGESFYIDAMRAVEQTLLAEEQNVCSPGVLEFMRKDTFTSE